MNLYHLNQTSQKKKAKKDKEVKQMLSRPAQLTVYSVCASTLAAAEPRKWAAQVRWSLNEKLRISLEAPLFVFKASPAKMLTNHQSNRLLLQFYFVATTKIYCLSL